MKCNKVYAAIVFVVALIVGFLVIQQSFDASRVLSGISRLLEVFMPILAIGALIKYIACGAKGCNCGTKNDSSCSK